jgi:hypothetical protein
MYVDVTEGLFTAMSPLVGLEVAQLAKSLATAQDTTQIRLFAAVRADVDKQMAALGEGLVAWAVGAHVFLRPVLEGVELSMIKQLANELKTFQIAKQGMF